jgi:parallel beta-helix repeat protein
LLFSCGDDSDADSSPSRDSGSDSGSAPPGTDAGRDEACSVTLSPSADDQSALQGALIDAASGDTVCLAAGRYLLTGQLSLATENVTVRGEPNTILDFSGQTSGANGMAISADHVTLESVRFENTQGDGVRASDVSYVTFRDVRVEWTEGPDPQNGGYGLYPVLSSHVLIENCYVSGASDAGIYVGQSDTIVMRNNEVTGNVAGLEIETSTDAEVYGNHAHGNTAGILVFNLPGLMVKDGKRANVHDNIIEDNNLANFAAAGNIVADVPAGTGLFILASDENEVHDNQIRDNQSSGASVLSWYVAQRDADGEMDPDFDWFPERNYVHGNVLDNNGQSPEGLAETLASLVGVDMFPDLLWDGIIDTDKLDDAGDAESADGGTAPVPPEALRNCFKDNGDASFLNMDLERYGERASTDITPYECEQPSLPAVEL